MSQIAGRAGRFKNDGGFGTTGDCETLSSDEIEKIENINYRYKNNLLENSSLNFSSRKTNIISWIKTNNKNLLKQMTAGQCFEIF